MSVTRLAWMSMPWLSVALEPTRFWTRIPLAMSAWATVSLPPMKVTVLGSMVSAWLMLAPGLTLLKWPMPTAARPTT